MDLARVFEGKKYMWDGQEYDRKEESDKVAKDYATENFEVQQMEEEGKHYLFTRRVVTEVVVEGSPT